MKKSIRYKMSAWVVGAMVAIIFIGGAIGGYFLEDYYINSKKNALANSYSKVLEMMNSDKNIEKALTRNALNEYCENKGVATLILNSDMRVVYAYGADMVLVDRMEEILFGSIISNHNYMESVVEETSEYRISVVTDLGRGNSKHLEISGNIDTDKYFLMRIAIENIKESITITARYYGLLSITLVIIVAIVILIITTRLTRPILQLADISKKMSKLNFDVRYEDNRDDEIGVLGRSMNEMSNALEKTISELKSANIELKKDIDNKNRIDNMRTEFLSSVSHELKTPIALIQGYAEGLKEGISDDPESMDYYCDVIIDEANKMNHMVKNLLNLNQIEFGTDHMVMERFDIVELIKGVLNAQSLRAKQNDVKIIFDATQPRYVWGDEFQIEEVITNYISNAFNHINGNRVIKVQIVEKDGIVRVSVFNTGDPIPETDIEHIWEKFYKVDKARTREYGGNGIGLSIVKAIMDGIGRKCGVLNHSDGVEFWFELDSK